MLIREAIESLNVEPHGCYIDATFGRGGHSREILKRLGGEGKLFAFDQDPEAMREAAAIHSPCFNFARTNFDQLLAFASREGIARQVNGVLIDLGVSSPQLDDADRGFSFMQNGPLDMRMSTDSGQSAAEWISSAEEKEIARVLWEYGEEKHSRKIAAAIVAERVVHPIDTTFRLVEIIKQASPYVDRHKHPATRTFQAIRIHVNKEIDVLKSCLKQTLDVLARGGRLVVISFHSLEDRVVKRFMRNMSRPLDLPKGLPIKSSELTQSKFKLVGKPVKPSKDEVRQNPRARSAIMRVAEMMV